MRKKVLLVIAFVAVAMVSGMISGSIVLLFKMNQVSVEAKSASQEAIVEMAQIENEKIAQVKEITFSCGVLGCTQTTVHSHGICDIAGCTETGTHMHNGEYCYPHSADDGHAYHTCGVSDCTQVESHTHDTNSCGVSGCTQMESHTHDINSCGVSDCTQTGDHSHGGDHESSRNSESSGGHHKSGHGGGHH